MARMTLNEFIARATSFFDKAEKAIPSADVTSELAAVKAALTERDAIIGTLQAELTKAQADAAAFTIEIKNLKAAVEKEANKANDTIAAQGLPASAVPEAKTAPSESSILAKLDAIKDPIERSVFFAKNKPAIMAEHRRK